MESRTVTILSKTVAALSILALGTGSLFAADYYISPTGDDGNSGVQAKPWKSIAKANNALQPGDTAFLMNGEYRDRIEPARSGASGRYITYQAYQDHKPTITAPPGKVAIVLNNRSYIRIDGLTVDGKKPWLDSNIDKWADLEGANNNIIQNSEFKYAKGWYAFFLVNSHNNKLLNNRMYHVGTFWNEATAEGMGDMIGLHCANNNLIQGNHLSRGGHNLLHVSGNYNVIRGNTFDNKWGDNIGYRSVELTANQRNCSKAIGFNVFENNILKNSLLAHKDFRGSDADSASVAMKVEGTGQIVRNNLFWNNSGAAISSAIRPPRIPKSEQSRIYNNTVIKNEGLWSLRTYSSGTANNNVFKNNLVHASTGADVSGDTYAGNFFITNLLKPTNGKSAYINTRSGTPSFVSTDPSHQDAFQLSRSSAMIDVGDFLTQTTDAGSGKLISVADAGWFTDGFGIVEGDLVQIGKNAPVRVTKVDYSNKTLLVDSSVSWTKGAAVSLPYEGAAPDIGRYEYRDEVIKAISPPSNLQVIKR